jgi:hypothetical protein
MPVSKDNRLTVKRIEHVLVANKAQVAKFQDGQWSPGFIVCERQDGFWVHARGFGYSRLSTVVERWQELLSSPALGWRVEKIGDTTLCVSEASHATE